MHDQWLSVINQNSARLAHSRADKVLQQEKIQTSRQDLVFIVWATPPLRAFFIGFRFLISRTPKMAGPYLYCSRR